MINTKNDNIVIIKNALFLLTHTACVCLERVHLFFDKIFLGTLSIN